MASPETTKPDVLEIMRVFGDRDCDYFPSDEWVAEAADEIERLRGHVRMLRAVVASAMEWDGADDEGVPAVWIEAAEEALKETE